VSLSALVHDVGKYVARTARNLPAEGEVPRVLIDMLCRDLYALTETQRASERFDELALELEPALDGLELDACRERFAEIDALEARVRDGDLVAVRRAAALALEIETELRGALG